MSFKHKDVGTELTQVEWEAEDTHISSATSGKMLKADANGLPADATNTDTEVADAVDKKHSANADTDLDATFEASLKNTDNHTSGTTNKVFTATEQTKLSGIEASATKYPDTGEQAFLDADHTKLDGIEAGAEANNISDADATDLTDGGATTLHSHAGGGAVPSGGIIMWAGTIANIPDGYVICDGNNGTPNLLARFVEGVATASTNPGTTGGATNKTTAGHTHGTVAVEAGSGANPYTSSATDTIADIRPPYYDIAFIMKT